MRFFGLLLLAAAVALVTLCAMFRLNSVKKQRSLAGEAKDSFLSQEIKNVIANAGGIYISLTLAAAFLKVEVGQELALLGVHFDALAALSLILAVVQPLIWPRSN